MGRGDPLPVAIPVRDIGNVGGGLPVCVAGGGADECDKGDRCCSCNQEVCEASHNGSSIQYALVNEISICFEEARMRNNWTIVLAKPSYQSMPQAFGDLGLEAPDFPTEPGAAAVPARQSRLVARGGLSISSASSSQSSVESLACSGPNNSVTARRNADNSRSAMLIRSLQVELQNDSSLSMGSPRI